MGYLRRLKVNELKDWGNCNLEFFNKQFNTNFEVEDIYKVPNMKLTWDRIIMKISGGNGTIKKLITIRPFGALDYAGFELIDIDSEKIYIFDNKQSFLNYTLRESSYIDDYIKEHNTNADFNKELEELLKNINSNNIKKRVSKN